MGAERVDRTELERALEARILELEATPFGRLWERYTEEGEYRIWRRWRFRRVRGPVGRNNVTGELTSPEGTKFRLREWASIEGERDIHIFVEVWGEGATALEIADGDTIVSPGDGQPG
jgi:hypothetical protein